MRGVQSSMSRRRLSLQFFGLLAGLLLDGCRSDMTVSNMPETMVLGVATKIREYELITGVLPTEEDGLQALITRPESLSQEAEWTQLYDELPTDPWGKQLFYVLDESLPNGFGVYCCGADRISESSGNDEDDFNSWD